MDKKLQPKIDIPKLLNHQLDDYLFGNWKPITQGIFEDFHIVPVEYYKNFLSLPVLPHRRSNYFFVYLTKGSSIRTKNLNTYEIKPGDFYCVPANQITSTEFLSEDAEGYYCQFSPEIFNQPQLKVEIEKDFPFFNISSEPIIKINDRARVVQMLDLLISEYQKNEIKRSKIIAFHLTSLLNEVNFDFGINKVQTANSAFLVTKEYKALLSEFLEEMHNVQAYASKLKISPNHLNKCVKEVTGKSAHQILTEMRVLHSKVLLKQTNLSIKEIAYKVAELDSSDFSKFFKKNTGVSPKEYRMEKS